MRRFVAVVAVSGLMATACSDDPTSSEQYQELEQQLAAAEQQIEELEAEQVDSEPTETNSIPIPAVPTDVVFVIATPDCTGSQVDIEPDEEDAGFLGLLWECEIDASDPRVSGLERHAAFRTLADSSDGLVWLVEDATITNDEGTWRGVALGADSGGPVQGEAHYVGEGAYEGLEYHHYFSDLSGSELETRGWISGDG